MENKHKNCQSCGISLSKNPEKVGLESDGTKSTKFCSYCYVDGKFVNPDMTVDKMKTLVKGKMKEMGFPGVYCRVFHERYS